MKNKIRVVHYTVSSNLKRRIVLVSDIHYYDQMMFPLLKELEKKIKEQNPNYICIPGDFIDERMIYDKQIFLDFLTSISFVPVFISIGNHEAKTKKDTRDFLDDVFISNIQSIKNVFVLKNQSVEVGPLRFTGLHLPSASYLETKKSYKIASSFMNKLYPEGLKKDKYNIVLSHSPYVLNHKTMEHSPFRQSIDLALCGHTHGGITPKWFIKLTGRCFISPQKRLFPKKSYGYLKNEKMIISSGVTKISHMNEHAKLFKNLKGEIVSIDL